MTASAKLLTVLDESWSRFSKAWKQGRSEPSEESIHAVRVNTRRLMSVVALTAATARTASSAELQRSLKKVFKGMGPLRDVQVQIKNLSQFRASPLIAEFRLELERRERRCIRAVEKQLKQSNRKSLSRAIKQLRMELIEAKGGRDEDKMHSAIRRFVASRRTQFVRKTKRFEPSDPDMLHEMRLALKSLRYTAEAAAPVIPELKPELARMQALQRLLGDIRDHEVLRLRLDRWALKRGRKIAVVPALETLQEKINALVHELVTSMQKDANPEPLLEKTLATAAGTAARVVRGAHLRA